MSWHFLQEQEEAYWEPSSSAGIPYALSRLMPSAVVCYLRGSATATSTDSQYGTTSEHSTANPGETRLTSSREVSRVSHSARQAEAENERPTYGQRCSGLLVKFDPDTCSQKMSPTNQSSKPLGIWLDSVSMVTLLMVEPPQWVRRMKGDVGGWLPTPTATANHDSPSMRKWPAYAAYQDWLGGKRTSPELWEWMMGLPIGWTDCAPLETHRFRQWLEMSGG